MAGEAEGLSFVVVTYNSRHIVQKCLESILAQEPPPSDIVIVDNASSDGTIEFIRSTYPDITIVENKHNLGYGKGNNIGVRRVAAPLVAIINPDVALDKSWSWHVIRALASHPNCAAVEGKLLLAGEPGILNSRGSAFSPLGFGCVTGYGEADLDEFEPRRVAYPSGAAFAIRRKAFIEVGGFDDHYFLYHEDVDLGLRLYKAGWSVLYAPRAIAYHDYRSGLNAAKIALLEENRWRTLAKNMPREYFIRCGPLLLVSEFGIATYLLLSGRLQAKIRAYLNFFRGLPLIMRERNRQSHADGDPMVCLDLITDAFPPHLSRDNLVSSIARRVQSGYFNAFLRNEHHGKLLPQRFPPPSQMP